MSDERQNDAERAQLDRLLKQCEILAGLTRFARAIRALQMEPGHAVGEPTRAF